MTGESEGMKPNLEKLNKIADKINRSAKILLKKNSLPSNLDLKIQIENQIEYFNLLNKLKAECRKKNLKVMMITLIVSHKKSDSLEKSYKILKSASKKLFYSVEYKKFEELIGVEDYIRRLEIEYCDAKGWHPHFHILLIYENSIAVESAESYEKNFSNKYLRFCINSGMTGTQKTKEFMTEHGIDITLNFEYLGYVSDYQKLLKPRIDNLKDKYFSPYQMPLYKGYESKFKEFAKFVKNKKFFEFSRPSIQGVNFVEWKEIDRTTKNYKPVAPNLSEILLSAESKDYWCFYEIQNRKFTVIYEFLPDKMLKHYNISKSGIDYRRFKLWLCFVSGVDWYNFYNYVKLNLDANLFSTKRRNDIVPELVKTLIESYEEFFICVSMTDSYGFLSKSQHQLIQEFENWSR